jgi:hypothetical protein
MIWKRLILLLVGFLLYNGVVTLAENRSLRLILLPA